MFRPHLFLRRKTSLNVPDMGRSSNERKYLLIRLSRFSDIQVFVRSATVRCHDILDKTKRLYS